MSTILKRFVHAQRTVPRIALISPGPFISGLIKNPEDIRLVTGKHLRMQIQQSNEQAGAGSFIAHKEKLSGHFLLLTKLCAFSYTNR